MEICGAPCSAVGGLRLRARSAPLSSALGRGRPLSSWRGDCVDCGNRYLRGNREPVAFSRTLNTMPRPLIGDLLREWRDRRKRSQLDLALEAGVSARHLSFVETGRSRPSPELVLALAEHLDVPLRERNTMLLAAGFAPRYSQTSLDDPATARVRVALQRMLDAQNPYPGVVIDRQWNVLLSNEAAMALTVGIPAHVFEPQLNVFRLCLHPDGLAGR